MYIKKCEEESKPNNEIDKELYAELVELDTRLQKEKKRLNDLGGKILREAGLYFGEGRDYDSICKQYSYDGYIYGYATYYLCGCHNWSKITNELDATVYQKLIDIDSTLGTELSDQLYLCLDKTTRWDIIKVLKFLQIKDLKNIIGYRL